MLFFFSRYNRRGLLTAFRVPSKELLLLLVGGMLLKRGLSVMEIPCPPLGSNCYFLGLDDPLRRHLMDLLEMAKQFCFWLLCSLSIPSLY